MSDLSLQRLILLSGLFMTASASAEIMNPQLPASSIGLGLSTLHVEQPDSNSEQRYRLDLHEFMRIPWGLRLHNRVGMARDTRPRADAVQVNHHFYELTSSLQWTGTWLFRYGLGAGPLVIIEETVTRVQLSESKQRTNTRLQLGAVLEAQLDYAFSTNWELALIAGLQLRPVALKSDFSFGVSLQYNRGLVRKDESGKEKALRKNLESPRDGQLAF